MHITHTKKFRHGSISIALTVIVIAAVILINAIFGALSEKFLWYVDMTPEPRFTLSEEAKGFLNQMDAAKQVTILFCDEKYAWEMDSVQLEVLKTALDIEKYYPNVKVAYTDIYTNPSSVNAYKELTGKNVTTQSVIVICDQAVRVYNLEDFFKVNDEGYVTGYDGEHVLVSSLLSVTRANAPVACITNNHGEIVDEAFVKLLEQIGFRPMTVDLTKEELHPDCRLLLIFDPLSDFLEKDGMSDISEIDKLEDFLDGNNSMMVFFDKDTPYLKNLEQFMAEWGIEIARTDKNKNTVIKDTDSSLTINGHTNKAFYETATASLGYTVTEHMQKDVAVPKTVAFPNTTSLRFSSLYQETLYNGYRSATYVGNVEHRTCYNVFFSSPTAVAKAEGETVSEASTDRPYSYMMITKQATVNDDGSTSNAFVLASASTDFAVAAALDSRYGNASVLSYACNTMGSLVVPVSLDCKYYANMEIAAITASAATTITVIFAVVPASVVFIAGIYVMIRRKHA